MATTVTVPHVARSIDEALALFATFGLPTDPVFAPDGGRGVTVTFSEALTAVQISQVHMLLASPPQATQTGMSNAVAALAANQAFLAQASPRTAAQVEAQVVALTQQIVTLALFTMGEPA